MSAFVDRLAAAWWQWMFAASIQVTVLLLIALVVALSIRLRRAEIVTMTKMGCSRLSIASILGSQIAIIATLSFGIALALTIATNQFGPELVRWLIL